MPVFELKNLHGLSGGKRSQITSADRFLKGGSEAGSTSRGSSPGSSSKMSTASTALGSPLLDTSPTFRVQEKNTFLHIVEEPTNDVPPQRCASSPALLVRPPKVEVKATDARAPAKAKMEASAKPKPPAKYPTAEELAAARAQVAIDHANGTCKPCLSFVFKDLVPHDPNCLYCHICSREEIMAKRKANKQAKRTERSSGALQTKSQPAA